MTGSMTDRRLDPALPARLCAALGEVRVDPGARSATVCGDPVTADDPRVLRGRLAGVLYERLHVGRPAEPEGSSRRRSLRDEAMRAALAAATPETDGPEVAGRLLRTDGDDVLVALPDARVRVPADRVRIEGTVARVRLPSARPSLSPGFFLVQSGRSGPAGSARRVYLHVPDPVDAPRCWRATLGVLDELGVGYRAKVTSAEHLYPRRDAVVVYTAAAERVSDALAAALDGVGLGAEVSPFARRVAPGVAVADEPSDQRAGRKGLSFGEHRCAVVAEALVERARAGSDPEPGAALEAVRAAFVAAGVDPQRPWTTLGVGREQA